MIDKIPGMKKPALQALPQIKDRISFLYLEHCLINRQDGAITVTDVRGTVHVPAAAISVLLLGPGTNVSHRAMELIGSVGVTVIWVGERGVRYYAHGSPLTNSARLLIKQAELVSNVRNRINVARLMYQMRFPHEDVSAFTMQQLRGREGARVRAVYRKASEHTGVKWRGREYNPEDYYSGSAINMALSAAHSCLYGIVHSVIVALGCSPGLGFVHTGHERSFVYDIADLYKAELSIPIAFEVAAEEVEDIGTTVRHCMRDAVSDGKILQRTVRDIRFLLLGEVEHDEDFPVDIIKLWDDKKGGVDSGVDYTDKTDNVEYDLSEGYGKILEE
ncbi:MAG: type I-E CRISPR-associated endonuclease Cas1 [Negativicutes bacterium]|nr:type I-E CRISPR-associated endonuclease Cas1 [Negativicutes bacterium]